MHADPPRIDGAKVRALRVRARLTVTDLAREAHVSRFFVHYVESGARQPSAPYALVLAHCLAEALDEPITVDDLAADDEDPHSAQVPA
jgi:predicted transcriptional regulator